MLWYLDSIGYIFYSVVLLFFYYFLRDNIYNTLEVTSFASNYFNLGWKILDVSLIICKRIQSSTRFFWKCLQVKNLKTTILGNSVSDQCVERNRIGRNWAGYQLGNNWFFPDIRNLNCIKFIVMEMKIDWNQKLLWNKSF